MVSPTSGEVAVVSGPDAAQPVLSVPTTQNSRWCTTVPQTLVVRSPVGVEAQLARDLTRPHSHLFRPAPQTVKDKCQQTTFVSLRFSCPSLRGIWQDSPSLSVSTTSDSRRCATVTQTLSVRSPVGVEARFAKDLARPHSHLCHPTPPS